MTRLPVAAFVALVIATVGAFFVTQHLKVSTPLIQGAPAPRPAAINPVSGQTCRLRNHRGQLVPVSFRRMTISFYLQHRADDVDVDIVNADDQTVDTIASGRHMPVNRRETFVWDGRRADGAYVPDGVYYIRVSLLHQGRSLIISNSSGNLGVTVERHAKPLTVTRVTPQVIPQNGSSTVTAHFTGASGRRPTVLVYRTDLPGGPRLVKTYNATTRHGVTAWDGTVQGGRPAPQGTYLIGLRLRDRACNLATFPSRLPPAPGSTPHAGVTIRRLAAQPALTPVAPGATTTVEVDARRHRYSWALRRAGTRAVLRSGSARSVALSVGMPRGGPGLYELALRSGAQRTAVPLVAGPGGGGPGRGRVLVVLPALTWQGENPVDDDGDGMPNTLTAGQPVRLARPLADGLPAGFADEAALVAWLRSSGKPFALTTDLALLSSGSGSGSGSGLRGYSGVVLAGSERWVPESFGSALSQFVEAGGHVLSLGIDSLRRSVTVSGGVAQDPTGPRATDFLLARPGQVTSTDGSLILVDRDDLRLFSATSGALPGFRSVQPFGGVTAPASLASAAGVSRGQPAIIGYRLGRGTVTDIGRPGFASAVRRNIDAQELLGAAWSGLTR